MSSGMRRAAEGRGVSTALAGLRPALLNPVVEAAAMSCSSLRSPPLSKRVDEPESGRVHHAGLYP
jgi:hypothetical protein